MTRHSEGTYYICCSDFNAPFPQRQDNNTTTKLRFYANVPVTRPLRDPEERKRSKVDPMLSFVQPGAQLGSVYAQSRSPGTKTEAASGACATKNTFSSMTQLIEMSLVKDRFSNSCDTPYTIWGTSFRSNHRLPTANRPERRSCSLPSHHSA
jgi:hypothetical protein